MRELKDEINKKINILLRIVGVTAAINIVGATLNIMLFNSRFVSILIILSATIGILCYLWSRKYSKFLDELEDEDNQDDYFWL